ncbi:hypothetical protein GT348_08110 [Aristophania vespae]|uniref:Glycosyltransferase family 8 protein n=2 Tax=Aristophania vespae TaxID=2697033 RepID=A0A6P1NFZ8_9PROT|nr:glycosyltransferase family 8 protein [Aristophania vespae]QHI96193.1 hypothetical protein GT348_08110 [Aristophania vespae]
MSFDNRNGYAQHAYSVINSILAHTSNHKDINIFVIYGSDLPLSKINEISRNFSERVSVSFLKIDSCFLDNLELEDNYLTKSAYNRLLVQDVLPDNVHRIIYLDTDILVCDDIVELWNIDLHDHVIGAIPDIYSVGNDKRLFGRASDGLYINSGVMLLDLELAQKRYGRLSSYFAKVFYEHKDKVKYHDQDILNLAFHNKILQLPLRWNVPGLLYYFWPRLPKDLLDEENNDFPRDELIFSLNNPGIIHFIEDRKPWKRNCFNPFKRLYWRYRAQNIQFKPSIEQRFCIWNNVFTWRAGTFAVASGKKIHHIHARSKWLALKQTFKSMKF